MTEVSRDDNGRGFLVEWNDELIDTLLQFKRGKPQYITADGRTFKRARLIGPLTRPTDPSVTQPDPPAAAIPTEATDIPTNPTGDVNTHWAANGGTATRIRTTEHRNPPHNDNTSTPTPTPDGDATPITETAPGQWTGVDHRNEPVTVWNGELAVDAVDDAIAYQQAVLSNLRQLRHTAAARAANPRQTAINDRIRALAAADGVHDLDTATPQQIDVWRRYAEALQP